MKKIRVVDIKVNPNPVIRNQTFFVQIKLEEVERGVYAREHGSADTEIYAGETLGKV